MCGVPVSRIAPVQVPLQVGIVDRAGVTLPTAEDGPAVIDESTAAVELTGPLPWSCQKALGHGLDSSKASRLRGPGGERVMLGRLAAIMLTGDVGARRRGKA